MAMQLALNQWSLWKELRDGTLTVEDVIAGAAKRGFRAIELLDYHLDESPDRVAALRSLCDEHGLTVCAYGIRNDFAATDPAQQISQGNRVKSGLACAAALGAPTLRILGGRVVKGLSFDEAETQLIGALQMALEFAAPRGIRIALENWGQLCGKTEQIIELVDAVGNPALGVTADLGNFLLVDENPVDSVRRLGSRIFHVHVNDFEETQRESDEAEVLTASSGRHFQGTVIGKGRANVPGVLDALSEMGYQGHLSLECESLEAGWQGVEDSLPALKSHPAVSL